MTRTATVTNINARLIKQGELQAYFAAKDALETLKIDLKERVENGALVEEGKLTAKLETRISPIGSKKYREWLVKATSEGRVSRREKLINRSSYEALIIRKPRIKK